MFFGGFKKISDIVKGDIVIDENFYPAIVMDVDKKICRPLYIQVVGRERFRMSPDGMVRAFNVASHLKKTMSIEEVANLESHWRDQYKLMSTFVQYRTSATKNDPYLVGLVIGSRATQIAQVVRDYFINRVDLLTNSIKNNATYKFTQVDKVELRQILKTKVLPDEYMFNDSKCRHMLLRGFIDSRKTSRVKRASSAERKRAVPRLPPRHTRSKSTVRRPVRSSNDLRKFIVPCAPTVTATPVSARSVSEHESDEDKSETSVQKIIGSRIPVLRKKEVVYEVQHPAVGEQIKTLVRSLGHDCVYIDGEITIYADMSSLLKPPENVQKTHTFKIVEVSAVDEMCYGLVLDEARNIILSNYVLARS